MFILLSEQNITRKKQMYKNNTKYMRILLSYILEYYYFDIYKNITILLYIKTLQKYDIARI